jgi:CRP-like cAMP-binding protein
MEAGTDLVLEGERPEKVFLLLKGWAFRYKILQNGKRQILAYLIPGDLCDFHIFVLKKMDYGIGLLSRATVAAVSPLKLFEIMREHRNVERALWWATLVDEAILREWLVNVGQRDAYERLAHLLYEMWLRANVVGLVSQSEQFSLPLTQAQLGDTVGLTPVAVNRALQRLRSEGLIILSQKQLTVPFPERLAAASSFEPNYLHLHQAIDTPHVKPRLWPS